MPLIFPWVEAEISNLDLREKENPNARDISARHFLKILQYFRTVLMQDLALLFHSIPDSVIFTVSPFNSDAFKTFAQSAPLMINEAELAASQAMQDVPENIASGIRVMYNALSVAQRHIAEQQQLQFRTYDTHLTEIKNMLAEQAIGPNRKRGTCLAWRASATHTYFFFGSLR